MGGTKFMVIKLKDLVKTAIFAILGVIILIALIYFLVPRDKTALYNPGVYTSSISINGEDLNVEVTVTDRKIKSVALVHTSETVPVFYPLFETAMEDVSKEIVKAQSTDVELPENAQVTSQYILEAVNQALEEAKVSPSLTQSQ